MKPPGYQSDFDLEAAAARAQAAYDQLSVREKDSHDIAQSLSFVIGNSMRSPGTDRAGLLYEQKRLKGWLSALRNPETTDHHMGTKIRQLVPSDRRSLARSIIKHLRNNQAELEAIA